MLIGIINNKRETAEPGIKATCPLCGKELIPKCGSIKIWHFAHKMNYQCDDWYEPESDWHFNWKNEFPLENQEVIITKDGKKHIADVRINNQVIEFQNSSISPEQINEREKFYGNMTWVLNGSTIAAGICLKPKGDYVTFRWKHPPKSWWNANKDIYVDLESYHNNYTKNKLLWIRKIYDNIPCGGWGYLITKEEFIKRVRGFK